MSEIPEPLAQRILTAAIESDRAFLTDVGVIAFNAPTECWHVPDPADVAWDERYAATDYTKENA